MSPALSPLASISKITSYANLTTYPDVLAILEKEKRKLTQTVEFIIHGHDFKLYVFMLSNSFAISFIIFVKFAFIIKLDSIYLYLLCTFLEFVLGP